jgi:crotonobetainyl-CoA:carnitine CoA-transferase CaiB-like acyl-CoA transferase
MQDAVVNIIRVSLRDHQRFGAPMPRRGNQMGQTVPSTVYPSAGGGRNDYVFINASQQPMWLAMLGVMGRAELAEDPRFATEASRWENRAALNAIVEEWTGARAKHEVMRLLGEAGVPCGAVQDTGEVLADHASEGARDDRRCRFPGARHLPNRRLPGQIVGFAGRRDPAAAARRAHPGIARRPVRRRPGRGEAPARRRRRLAP